MSVSAADWTRARAEQFQCHQATVWRACHRYQTEGIVGLTRRQQEGTLAAKRHDFLLERAQIIELACLEPLAKRQHVTRWSSEYVSTGHGLVTWSRGNPWSEVAEGQDGGRFQTCFSEASTHQILNREKRENSCPSRVVAGEFAGRDEICSGKRLRVLGILAEGVRFLGLRANEQVTRQSERLVRRPGIVRPQDNETGEIEAGRASPFREHLKIERCQKRNDS